MPVDTSSYPTASTKPADPFAMVNQLLGVQQGALKNQLLQQGYDSNLALGNAYKSALDPTTGVLDASKLPGAVANSGAAYRLPEALQAAQDYQTRAAQLGTAQSAQSDASLGNYRNRQATIDNAVYPLLNDPDLSYAKVIGAAHNVFASNGTTMQPGDLSGLFGMIPRAPNGGPPTPEQLRIALQQYHTRALSPAEQTTTQTAKPTGVSTGDGTTFVDTNPITNPGITGTTVAANPAPGLTDGPNVKGQPTKITNRQAQDLANGRATMDRNTGAITYPGGTPAYAGGGAPGSGSQPPIPSIRPLPQGGGTASSVQAGAIPVGAPIGSDADAAQNVTQANAFQSVANGSANRKAMLGNLETDLQNFTSGPGADWTNVAKAWANRNVLPSGLNFQPQSIASQEAFTKQATNLAQDQFASLGGTGTDAQLGSSAKANPNVDLSKLGNTQIIQLLKGNEDALTARNQAWQAYKQSNGPGSYGQFSSKFNQVFDPRVFQSQYQDPAGFKSMMRSMSAQEQSAFKAKLATAQRSGWVSGPGSMFNGQQQ